MKLQEIRQEPPLTSYLFTKAGMANIPVSGTFELSPVCNFACRMCYVRKTQEEVAAHSRPMMTRERWLKIAEQAREEGMLYLLLTGGEPLLWKDFWLLYEELSKMGFLISINTNGSLIDAEAIRRLQEMPPVRVNITLYGASDETYEALCRAKGVFSKVDRAVAGLKEAGIEVKLNSSLTPHNAADLERMTAYAAERGLLYNATTYMYPPIRRDPSMIGQNDRFTPREAAYYGLERYRFRYGEEQYQEYLRQLVQGLAEPPAPDEACIDPVDGKIRCRAGNASFWITWDGRMLPCGMMNGSEVLLEEGDFRWAWRQLVEKSSQLRLSGICEKCESHEFCHACAAMAVAETGSIEGVPHYLCEMTREVKRIARETVRSDGEREQDGS